MNNEITPGVLYREGPLTLADYDEAIEDLLQYRAELAKAHGWYCPCGDDCGPAACRHNPLLMARRGADKQREFRCYHCGEVFIAEEQCKAHFGLTQDAIPQCFQTKQNEWIRKIVRGIGGICPEEDLRTMLQGLNLALVELTGEAAPS